MKTFNRLFAASVMVMTAAQAFASSGEGQHGGGAGHHAPHVEWFKWDMNAPPVGWLIFDFALFLFLLVKFAGKPLSNALAQRHHAVKKAIEEAAAAKADALKKAAEFDARIKALDAEIAQLREEFKKSGEAARDRLQESGKRTAERLLKDTQLQIGAEETRAREALQQEAARLALEMAEKLVGERIKDTDHKKFKDDFVAGLRS